MNQIDFYALALELGANPDSQNFVIKRDQFVEFMKRRGYANRTIQNNAYPSTNGGLISKMLSDGMIVEYGCKQWMIPFVQRLNEKARKKSFVRMYRGNPPPDDGTWIKSSRLDNCSSNIEWRLFRQKQEFTEGKINLKVVAIGGLVENKANYWMYFDRETSSIGSRGRDSELLKQHRPDIYASLLEDLEEL